MILYILHLVQIIISLRQCIDLNLIYTDCLYDFFILDQEKVIKEGTGLKFSIDVECPGEILSVTDFENDVLMELQAHSTCVNISMYCDDHVTVSFKTECVYLFDRDIEGNKSLFMRPKEMQLSQTGNRKLY